jgi:hypothetical protein
MRKAIDVYIIAIDVGLLRAYHRGNKVRAARRAQFGPDALDTSDMQDEPELR